MDVAFLCRVLEGTLSPDNKMRKAAEGRLHAMVSSPGYIVTLLQLIQAPDMPVAGECRTGVSGSCCSCARGRGGRGTRGVRRRTAPRRLTPWRPLTGWR